MTTKGLIFSDERTEYYRKGREVLEVKTCACCCCEGNYDAWVYKKGEPAQSCGVSLSYLKDWTLMTRRDAEKRVAKMGHALFLGVINEEYRTPEQKLWEHVAGFIVKQDIHHSETVYQSDRVIQNAYEFVDGCCQIVGFKPMDREDDD
ncbi:hypothetical protein [Aureimonas sp. AU40]|uniref:hypothetical protein n=1 Tax=Aureimonas sp. AU40 TaxID=1637747 RepID=UPI000782EC99|nr:hypothetical protein [Aureimonas sp. AU40]